MAQQLINVGTVANDGTGDSPRTVGQKANANFTELYSGLDAIVSLPAGGTTNQLLAKLSGVDYAADWVDAASILAEALAIKQDNTRSSKTTFHTPSLAGVVNGTNISSGQTPIVSGAGTATTVTTIPGGGAPNYISDPTNENTYIYVNSGSKITRVTQRFSGRLGIVAIGLAGSAANCVHCEFNNDTTSAACTIFITGEVGGQQMAVAKSVNLLPNIDNGVPHELVVEIIGDYVSAYCDGICVGEWYDPRVSQVAGNWYFSQITFLGCRIYGFESYDGQPQYYTINCGQMIAAGFQAQVCHVGRVSLPGYNPRSSIYMHTANERALLDGDTFAIQTLEAFGAGHVARHEYKNALGVELQVGVGAANGHVTYQGNEVIQFPVNGFVGGTYMRQKQFIAEGIIAEDWPTADPGSGKLWKNGGVICVGASVGVDFTQLYTVLPTSLTSVTYNADGSVNVITLANGYSIAHVYTSGLLSQTIETKASHPTVTTTFSRNALDQITSSTRVIS